MYQSGLSNFISTLCKVLLMLSVNQQHAALANASFHPPITMPHQKPKHKLHLNNSSNSLSLRRKPRGRFRIVPYFNIQCNPTQANRSITVFLVYNINRLRNQSCLFLGECDDEPVIVTYLNGVLGFAVNLWTTFTSTA